MTAVRPWFIVRLRSVCSSSSIVDWVKTWLFRFHCFVICIRIMATRNDWLCMWTKPMLQVVGFCLASQGKSAESMLTYCRPVIGSPKITFDFYRFSIHKLIATLNKTYISLLSFINSFLPYFCCCVSYIVCFVNCLVFNNRVNVYFRATVSAVSCLVVPVFICIIVLTYSVHLL